jgi:hypothetical protein
MQVGEIVWADEGGRVCAQHKLALRDVEEEQKEHILCHTVRSWPLHLGLSTHPLGHLSEIVKNLRVCGDCHSAIKFISKIVEREIVVRDATVSIISRMDMCSCGDYW